MVKRTTMPKKMRKKVSTVRATKRTVGKKWVIAVDPFASLDLRPIWTLVKPMAEQSNAKLHAIYVLAPSSFNWTGDFSGPWVNRYRPIAEEKMRELVPDEDIEREVISCKDTGLRAAVKSLLRYAARVKADSIVISTHARHGLQRLAMGSFAETLILMSKIPVLVINPNNRVPNHVRKILVPVDLSRKSERFIDSVADYAKKIDAEIVLYHKQPDPLDPVIQQGVYSLGGGWISVQSYMEAEINDKSRQMEKIESNLRRKHVSVSHVFDSSPGGLVESIDKAAHNAGADMVSVLTQSDSLAASLLGSVARGLVRNASVPILVRR